jgi:hypothetical protein
LALGPLAAAALDVTGGAGEAPAGMLAVATGTTSATAAAAAIRIR